MCGYTVMCGCTVYGKKDRDDDTKDSETRFGLFLSHLKLFRIAHDCTLTKQSSSTRTKQPSSTNYNSCLFELFTEPVNSSRVLGTTNRGID